MTKIYDFKLIEEVNKKNQNNIITNKKGQKYTIIMPPPNVTGSLHLGHCLNYGLIDVLIRYKQLKGYNVHFQSGFDHAGIATQLMVQKKYGIISDKTLFLEKTDVWIKESTQNIKNQLNKFNILCSKDFYYTKDTHHSSLVSKVFIKLYKKNLIYREKKLVNWDTHFKTAISDLEVDNREKKGKMYIVNYMLSHGNNIVSVGTTRPETIFGDTALLISPDNKELAHLIGETVLIPYTQRRIPIIGHKSAKSNMGTGILKITPAHDFKDFELGKELNLEPINIMDDNGCLFGEYVPSRFVGKSMLDVRAIIEKELNLSSTNIIHTIPYGNRSDSIIEPKITIQWFFSIDKFKKDLIDIVNQNLVKILPINRVNSYYSWVNNLKPWCISRQIMWGHNIPVWYDKKNNIYVGESEAAIRQEHNLNNNELLHKDMDVLDTWFSSSIYHLTSLNQENDNIDFFKNTSDVLITGHDIMFFWVTKMMIMSICLKNDSDNIMPFKTIIYHGLVRDKNNNKMSKTLKNVIDPIDIINKYGSDSLKIGLFNENIGRDLKIHESLFVNANKLLSKLWNAYQFIVFKKTNVNNIKNPISPFIDWMIDSYGGFSKQYDKLMDDMDISSAFELLKNFFWNKFCNQFLEMYKSIGNNGENFNYLHYFFLEIMKKFYAFCPDIATYIMDELKKSEINESDIILHHKNHVLYVENVISIRDQIRSIGKELRSSSLILEDKKNYFSHDVRRYWEMTGSLKVVGKYEEESGIFIRDLNGNKWLISGDYNLLKKRYSKELSAINKQIDIIKGRLNSSEFKKNAPTSLINKIKCNLKDLKDRQDQINSLSSLE